MNEKDEIMEHPDELNKLKLRRGNARQNLQHLKKLENTAGYLCAHSFSAENSEVQAQIDAAFANAQAPFPYQPTRERVTRARGIGG